MTTQKTDLSKKTGQPLTESEIEKKYLLAITRGNEALTDLDILELLSGSRGSALKILSYTGGCLNRISRMTVMEFEQFVGIEKAMILAAAMEFNPRKQRSFKFERFTNSSDVAKYIEGFLSNQSVEKFYAIFLNRNNERILTKELFSGGISATVIDPRIIFKEAILCGASGIIFAHNHPSGNLTPSAADITITEKLKKGGKVFDINVLDHLIISSRGYYSFADEGNLN